MDAHRRQACRRVCCSSSNARRDSAHRSSRTADRCCWPPRPPRACQPVLARRAAFASACSLMPSCVYIACSVTICLPRTATAATTLAATAPPMEAAAWRWPRVVSRRRRKKGRGAALRWLGGGLPAWGVWRSASGALRGERVRSPNNIFLQICHTEQCNKRCILKFGTIFFLQTESGRRPRRPRGASHAVVSRATADLAPAARRPGPSCGGGGRRRAAIASPRPPSAAPSPPASSPPSPSPADESSLSTRYTHKTA